MNVQLYLLAAIALAAIALVAWGIIYTLTTGKPFIVIDTGKPKVDADDAAIIEPVSLDALQGTWRMVSVGRNGNFAPQHVIDEGNVAMQITSNQFRLSRTDGGGTLALDNTATPNHLDQLDDDGDVHLCIVRFHNDQLEICQAGVDKKRPTNFNRQRSDGTSLTRFQRLEDS